MPFSRSSRRISYGTAAMAAGAVGLGGYVVGKSMDTSRTPPPSSAVMSYAVIFPVIAGLGAWLLTRKKNHSASLGALAGAGAGAIWAFLQFPNTPAGVAANVQGVIAAAQAAEQKLIAQQNAGNAGGAQQATSAANQAMQSSGATTAGAGAAGTGNGLSRFMGGIPLQKRFVPGVTPRIGGTVTMGPLGAARRRRTANFN